MNGYSETGGLRCGESFWFATHATWPFVTLNATSEKIVINLSVIGIIKKQMEFAKGDIKAIVKKKGMLPFNTGIVIEHSKQAYPPFVLFWTFGFGNLKQKLLELGFKVVD